MKTKLLIVALSVLLSVAGGVSDLYAQTGRTGASRQGQSNAFGQSGFGLQQGGAFGSGNGAFGIGQQQGRFGQGGLGQGGLGQGGLRQQLGGNQGGQFNQSRFVGGSADEIRQQMREMFGNQRRNRFTDFQIENLNEQRRSEREGRGNDQPQAPVRVQLRPKFKFTKRSSAAVTNSLQISLTRILNQRGVGTPQVEIRDRTAILRGVVTDEEQRALVEKLVMLEPGISQVENLLDVVTDEGPRLPTGG